MSDMNTAAPDVFMVTDDVELSPRQGLQYAVRGEAAICPSFGGFLVKTSTGRHTKEVWPIESFWRWDPVTRQRGEPLGTSFDCQRVLDAQIDKASGDGGVWTAGASQLEADIRKAQIEYSALAARLGIEQLIPVRKFPMGPVHHSKLLNRHVKDVHVYLDMHNACNFGHYGGIDEARELNDETQWTLAIQSIATQNAFALKHMVGPVRSSFTCVESPGATVNILTILHHASTERPRRTIVWVDVPTIEYMD